MQLPNVSIESLRAAGISVDKSGQIWIVRANGEEFRVRDLRNLTWHDINALRPRFPQQRGSIIC